MENFFGIIGNFFFFIGFFFMIFGWVGIILFIIRRYEFVFVVEIEGEFEEMFFGVYIIFFGLGFNFLLKFIKGCVFFIIICIMLKSVRKVFNIKEVLVLWIIVVECSEGCVNFCRFEYLFYILVNFMWWEEILKFIYFDGFEYLVIENGFIFVYKFFLVLKDYVFIINIVILVFVEKVFFNEREWNLLRREFEFF